MSDRTSIEWAQASWNPLRAGSGGKWYCEKLSPGCDNCYSSTFNRRMGGMLYPDVGKEGSYQRHGLNPVHIDQNALDLPRSWRAPRRIFVCSMTDLFGEWVTDDQIDEIFAAMVAQPRHSFLVLTKRPTRMLAWWRRSTYARWLGTWPAHIWAGTTIESQSFAWRVNVLRELPAPILWVSAEPLLSELRLDLTHISWLVVGGESAGPDDRRLVTHLGNRMTGEIWTPKQGALTWVRALRDQCQAAGVPFFWKQWGGPTPKAGGRLLDGKAWDEFPQAAVPSSQ